MAKSIRSKSKRKMRALKRQRLAPRVLKRLQSTVSNLNVNKIKMEIDNSDDPQQCDSVMNTDNSTVQLSRMEVDGGRLNLKTMKKADGTYPIWFSQRNIKKKMKVERKMKLKAKKKKKARK